jgi:hypothetical protein
MLQITQLVRQAQLVRLSGHFHLRRETITPPHRNRCGLPWHLVMVQ